MPRSAPLTTVQREKRESITRQASKGATDRLAVIAAERRLNQLLIEIRAHTSRKELCEEVEDILFELRKAAC